jgi:cytochrome c oxidase subunit 1
MVSHADGGHEHVHAAPTGWIRKYIFSLDHKVIGIQYFLLALFSVFLGMTLSVLMRMHLVWPGLHLPFIAGGVMTPEQYLALLTMHGTIMVFMVLTTAPQSGFGNYFLPIQIGAADMAFPVLNMLSFWTTFVSLVVMVCAFFVEEGAPISGWTAYTPLSALGKIVGPGQGAGQTLWVIGLAIFCAASLMGALNFITTLIDLRAPGLSLMRMPLTCWAWFLTAILGLLAFGVLLAACALLLLDRVAGTSFFIPGGLVVTDQVISNHSGGSPLWPSRSLHRDSARHGRRVARAFDVLAQAGIWLSRDGVRDVRNWIPGLLRLGPPHVHQRHEPVFGFCLFHHDDDHRRSIRNQNF